MGNLEQKIDDLLVEWEAARLEGRSVSIQEICQEHPELLEQVAAKVAVLQDLSWAADPFEMIADRMETNDEADLPGKRGGKARLENANETILPHSELTVREFVAALSGSGLLDEQQLAEVNDQAVLAAQDLTEESTEATKARALATRLVHQKLLTEYQARVILERGDSPLLLDRYVILDSIGAGGMGIVFKALQVSLDRVVAVKVLPQHFVDSPDKVARFQREMRSVARLSHPNVVQAYDAHESNGVYFFAMEFVPGSDLAAVVEERGPLSAVEAARVCAQVAKGLASAHASGIVHRDVKPSNVLLSSEGVAKVLDLGLARTRELAQDTTQNDLTRDGLTMGTVSYMSPEQAFDAKNADERSDIYSLGCTLYFLIQGKPMFDDVNMVRTIVAHRETPAPKLSVGRNDVPLRLEELYQEMVAKQPGDRPKTMQDVQLRLEKIATTSASSSSVPLPPRRVANSSTPVQAGKTTAAPLAATAPPIPPPVVRPRTPEPAGQHAASGAGWKWLAAALAMALMLAVGLILGSGYWGAPSSPEHSELRQFVADLLGNTSATMVVVKEGEEYIVDYPSELPPEPFQIIDITMRADEIHDFNELKQFPDLRHICIVGAADEDSPDAIVDLFSEGIDELTGIQMLDILDCALDAPAAQRIGALKNLDTLHLTGCELPADMEAIGSLPNLRTLSLDETDASDVMVRSIITGQLQLDFLDVSYTDISEQTIEELASLASLKSLELRGLSVNSVTSKLAAMPAIESLDLSFSNLNDEGLVALQKCETLLTLLIEETEVTQAGIDAFERANPSCELIQDFEFDSDVE